MRIKRLKSVFAVIATFSLVTGLSACGGGGGGGSNNATSTTNSGSPLPPVAITPAADGKLHAACTNCGAADDSTYSGSGMGLWQALNTSAQSDTVNVSINGATGRSVTLVFTNEGSSQTMSAVPISASVMSAADVVTKAATQPSTIAEDPHMAAVREFNTNGWKALVKTQSTAGAAAAADVVRAVQRTVVTYNVGDLRDFWVTYGTQTTQRHMTLEATTTTADGTKVNLWVETTEYGTGKITPAIVSTLLQNYAGTGGVYDMVTGVGGPFWGTVTATGMIPGGQPVDLVVANFNHDGQPYGTVGYFWAMNNFVNQGSNTATQYSNSDLSLYLDSETLYLVGTAGMQAMQTVMAHESTHMQNFYRRDMLMGAQYAYDSWLEETTAMMMEDWVSFNIDPTYNSVRDGRFTDYLTYAGHGSYTCGLTTWDPADTTCDSYTTNGSFGGFLNRQLGLTFYKTLLNDKNATASIDILNDAIKQVRPGSSVAQELRHFTVAAGAQVPFGANMSQYAFPARSEGGFTLPSIDPSTMTRDLPSASPGVLLGYASFPAVRANISGSYQETLTLPPGVTLSVVVQ